ncbi:MAG: hypothetical protein CMJ80_18020, partial [Planctomycetaceae bacterium]|nr:hypothetical protein [Planctomycetaceae bacterium]
MRHVNPIRLLIPPIVLTVLLTVCPNAHGDEVVSFDDHVKPILQRRCLKCHGNDEQQADLNLQNYATLMKGGSGGPVVKAGRPTSSVMFQAITAKEAAARMPPESPPLPV